MFNMLLASFHGFEYLFRHNYKQTSYVLAFPCYPAKKCLNKRKFVGSMAINSRLFHFDRQSQVEKFLE